MIYIFALGNDDQTQTTQKYRKLELTQTLVAVLRESGTLVENQAT